jgi:hypothetical protein
MLYVACQRVHQLITAHRLIVHRTTTYIACMADHIYVQCAVRGLQGDELTSSAHRGGSWAWHEKPAIDSCICR